MLLPWQPLVAIVLAWCLSLAICFTPQLAARDRSLQCPTGLPYRNMDTDARSSDERYGSGESASDVPSYRWKDRSMLLEGVLHKLTRHVDILEAKRKHDSEARKVIIAPPRLTRYCRPNRYYRMMLTGSRAKAPRQGGCLADRGAEAE